METFFLSHRPLWCLVFGGVLERYPELRVVINEQGADWLPETLAAMDGLATSPMRRAAREHPLPRLPSEYWRRHCFVANSLIGRPDVEQRERMGLDQMVFGSDVGHHEGLWPEIRRHMSEMFEGCPAGRPRRPPPRVLPRTTSRPSARPNALAGLAKQVHR